MVYRGPGAEWRQPHTQEHTLCHPFRGTVLRKQEVDQRGQGWERGWFGVTAEGTAFSSSGEDENLLSLTVDIDSGAGKTLKVTVVLLR